MAAEKKVTVYMIECEGGYYYGGKTEKNKYERFYEHHIGNGSEFTKLHKPLKFVEVIENTDAFDEDKITLKYMDKFGIDKVRGGTYSKITLSNADVEIITKQLRSVNDKCLKCGSSDHFIKDCKQNNQKPAHPKSDKKNTPTPNKPKKVKKVCLRCGRNHDTEKCYANTDVTGTILALSESDEDDSEVVCKRCMRSGHIELDCYAKTDNSGRKL